VLVQCWALCSRHVLRQPPEYPPWYVGTVSSFGHQGVFWLRCLMVGFTATVVPAIMSTLGGLLVWQQLKDTCVFVWSSVRVLHKLRDP
jgi:hypothetical protein